MSTDTLDQAVAAHQANDITRALPLYRDALATNPQNDAAWYNYGIALAHQNNHAEAAQALLKAVNLNAGRPESWLALARSLVKIGQHQMAAPILQQLDANNPEIAYLQSRIAEQQGDLKTAETLALQAGQQASANDPYAWLELARLYLEDQSYTLALAVLDRACAADPDAIEPEWLRTFTCALPIYKTQQQITQQLQLYIDRGRALLARLQKLPQERLRDLDYLITISHGLFLGYNGENVKEAQQVAGALFTLVMDANYQVPPLPPRTPAEKIKLAIVSETFYYHSNMKLRRSWLRRIDRSKFTLCLYHVGAKTDFYTDEIRGLCDEFYHIPDDLAGVIAQLQQDLPDIIQYTNLGLNPLTLKLATHRLAPVQCTTWGHPISSGFATIDYYLSSDLMEPADADTHYSEQLVRLPGLSVVPERIFDKLPPQEFPRESFGLTENDLVYLCLQSVQKYLPEHDDIYVRIALQVPRAKFVFIDSDYPNVSQIFKSRLAATFAQHGLNAADFLVFLPTQDQPHYRALHQLADITLDSLAWSGANTSFEALELGGLLLTCPGAFMRGQHTSAILQQMQATDLIARDVDHYIDLAIKLGADETYRTAMRTAQQEALPNLYNDPGLGSALNNFYESTVKR